MTCCLSMSVLEGIEGHVVYKKKQIRGGRFLYSYRDARKAAIEEADYLTKAENQKTFEPEKYSKKSSLFGVIVFESDQDLDPKTAYQCYDDRWLLELVFNRYKSDDCLDRTNVQGDFSVIGSEFVNFITTVMTCRIIRKATRAGLLNKMSYGDLMDDLSSAWRKADAPQKPKTDDGCWVHTLQIVFEELEALGLSEPVPKPEPKKRGRKKKEPEVSKAKRPRGRPRKDANQSVGLLYKIRAIVERAINHFKINMCIAGRKTRNHTTTKADVFFAGIASQLTVIVAYAMNCPQYIRSLKPLVV